MNPELIRALFAERQQVVDELAARAEAFRAAHPEIPTSSRIREARARLESQS